jgi:hypothetical protein
MPIVPMVAEVVMQFKFLSAPALTVGNEVFTVTTTASVAVQPLALVTVTVYVLVKAGEAIGMAIMIELNPVEGLHE